MLSDTEFGQLPQYGGNEAVAVGKSCLAISASPEIPTRVEIHQGSKVDKDGFVTLWDGHLDVPSEVLTLSTIYWETLARISTPPRVHIRISGDDSGEPTHLIIEVIPS